MLVFDDSTLLSNGKRHRDQRIKMKNSFAGLADHVSQACAPCGLKVKSVQFQYFVVALSSLIREKLCASLRLLIVVIFDQAPPEKKKRFLFNFHHSEKS